MPELSLSSVVGLRVELLHTEVGGETLVLSLDTERYYGLDSMGTAIWRLLQEPRPVHEIRDRLLEAYEVDPGRCDRELLAFLSDLLDEEIIWVGDA
jgi:hypothetical protein